ncbi:MAG: FxLYD domain-containing protein [Bacteroidia bacterium]|nr:FxLYD domain-containing protein [Bacteroidia bacterium]
MNRQYFYFAIILLAVAGLLFVLNLGDDQTVDDISIEFSEFKTDQDGIKAAELILKNNTTNTAFGVELIIQFIDDQENILVSSAARTDSISAGKTWTVSIPVEGENVFDFKILSITTTEDLIP